MTTTENKHLFLDDQSIGKWQEILLNTLAELRTETDLQHKKRELRRVQIFVFLLIGFLITIFLRDAIIDIIQGLPKGDWGTIFKALAAFFSCLPLIPGIRLIFTKYQTILDQGLPLRANLVEKDVVPLATIQPSLLKDQEISTTPKQIGPLKRWKIRATLSTIAGIFLLLLPISLIALFVYFVPISNLLLQSPSLLNFLNGFIVLELFLSLLFTGFIGYSSLMSAWQAANGARVIADQWEIRWRQKTLNKRHKASISWHEVQGFYCISYLDQKKRKSTVYFLDGPDIALTWKITYRSSQEMLEASELLTRYIITWAHQPLRDLSIVAMELFRSPMTEEQNIDPS